MSNWIKVTDKRPEVPCWAKFEGTDNIRLFPRFKVGQEVWKIYNKVTSMQVYQIKAVNHKNTKRIEYKCGAGIRVWRVCEEDLFATESAARTALKDTEGSK